MKNVLFLLSLLFLLGYGTIYAQVGECGTFSTSPANDESYDMTFEYNLVDVYLKSGGHYEFVYNFHFEHVKGGNYSLEYRLKYQRGYSKKMPDILTRGVIVADDFQTLEEGFTRIFFNTEKKGVVTNVKIRYNYKPTNG